jgi:peptidoglycan/LPS O-acetylase OafA/YrhL
MSSLLEGEAGAVQDGKQAKPDTADAGPAAGSAADSRPADAAAAPAASTRPASTGPASGPRRPHVQALDLVRVLVIAFVVSVHTTSFAIATSTPVGAFITVFHTSRELFFLLTAFVLVYNYGRRPHIDWLPFWRKRYTLVLPAYLVWSLIYFFFDHERLDPVTGALASFGDDLLNGSARYHLYFLLVTMQVYLAFPLVRWLLRWTAGHHGILFAVVCAYQIVFTLAVQHHLVRSGVVGWYLGDPSPWLPSYPFFILAGGLAAWHFESLAAFTRRRVRLAGPVFAAGLCAGLVSYAFGIAAGLSPLKASAVFQPAVVVETICFGWALLAVSMYWADHGARHRRLISAGADGSFGIYLAHPLLLQGLLALAAATGVLAAVRAAPVGLQIAAVLGVAVPLVYGLAAAVVVLIRPTPLSLPLTGRRARHRTD